MTYSVEQSCFFFPWGLTPTECAAWVQTWTTLLAIVGSVALAGWQTRRLLRANQKQAAQEKILAAQALFELGRSSRTLQIHLSEQLASPEAIAQVELTGMPTTMAELAALENALRHFPLATLAPALLGPASMLASTLHQYRLRVDALLQRHRQLDLEAFDAHLESLNTLSFALQEALADLERNMGKLRAA